MHCCQSIALSSLSSYRRWGTYMQQCCVWIYKNKFVCTANKVVCNCMFNRVVCGCAEILCLQRTSLWVITQKMHVQRTRLCVNIRSVGLCVTIPKSCVYNEQGCVWDYTHQKVCVPVQRTRMPDYSSYGVLCDYTTCTVLCDYTVQPNRLCVSTEPTKSCVIIKPTTLHVIIQTMQKLACHYITKVTGSLYNPQRF